MENSTAPIQKPDNIRSFLLGFFGWFLFVTLYWVAVRVAGQFFMNQPNPDSGMVLILCLPGPLLISGIAFIVLLFTKRLAALGLFSAIMANWVAIAIFHLIENSKYYYPDPFPVGELFLMVPFYFMKPFFDILSVM